MLLNSLKVILGIAAILAVIAFGLFFPMEESVKDDAFRAASHEFSYESFSTGASELKLEEIVNLHTVYSSKDDIRSGRFKYREGLNSWRFTTPIDWGKPHDTPDVRRVIERLVMMDPFLRSYAETGSAEDFRQAVFFLLDWQSFYQDGHKVTAHTWDVDAAKARTVRLAYVLSEINRNRESLPENPTIRLMELADFHVQRVVDPVYGLAQDEILTTPEFSTLCNVLPLPACETQS